MRRLLLITVAMLAISGAMAQQPKGDYVQVYGYVEREITPDRFVLSISIAERDSKGKISVEEQERAMIAALKGADIDVASQLRLANSASDYFKRGVSLTTTNYELELHSTDELSAAFRALNPLALSSVTISRIERSDIEQIIAEMRRDAMQNARTRAQELASAIDQKVGVCHTINDYNSGYNYYFSDHISIATMEERACANAAVMYDKSAIEFRSEKVSYAVQAVFELLP